MTKIGQYILCSICILISSLLCEVLSAQKNCNLIILPVDRSVHFIDSLKLQILFPSKFNCIQYVQQLQPLLASRGYVSVSIDSVKEDSFDVRIKLFAGEKYIWKSLDVDAEVWPVLNQSGYKKESFNDQPFDQEKVNIVYNRLLDYYSNNGYPFVKINLDSIEFSNGLITAKLHVDKGILYHIDSIRIYGNLKITQDFIHRYFDMSDHEIYNAYKLSKINELLAALPYVEESHPWDVTMLGTGAILNLYLQPKRSNEINALVGFLPANAQLGGKLLLTGDVELNLKNAFATGETIGLNWQQLQPRSPRLNLLFQRPYLFHSPFGLDFNFSLYKMDSFYVNLNAQFSVQYILSAQQSGKIILQTSSSNVLNVDTLQVIATKQLPNMIDVSSSGIGLEYDFNNTNYLFNPRSGNAFSINGSVGNNNIKKNNTILQIKDISFNYAQLYDSIKLKSYQFRIKITASHYFPLGKQATLKTSLDAGLFQSPYYFNNQLFQIGGYKLLRGFDEESIYTNRYAAGTLEYRYLLGMNSYFFGFTDYGWAQYKNNITAYSHTYLGVGFGLAFETKTGIFNISYAVGKRNDFAFSLQQSKIHLGFVSVF